MTVKPYTLFISDLHLSLVSPAQNSAFFEFIQKKVKAAEALYILGDFFNAYVGDDIENDLTRHIDQVFRELIQKGVKIYFMPGNRDFLVGAAFFKRTGVIALKDPTVIDLYGKKTLLMHGDSLCTLDKKYQQFRKKARNRFYQKLFLLLPKKMRLAIAEKMRHQSLAYQQELNADFLDVFPADVVKQMLHHGVTQMIHGHTHRPAIHEVSIQNQPCYRYVLGDWHPEGVVLWADAEGLRLLKSHF